VKLHAIHQFHAGAQFGDGVTNSMFYIQRILRQAGFESEIFAVRIDQRVRYRVNDFRSYRPRANELLLVHYSLGTDDDAWIEQVPAPKILVYHNITPKEFMLEGSDTWKLIIRGRNTLKRWADADVFDGAIGLSNLNATELRELGFPRVRVNSLLIDLNYYRRLMGPLSSRPVKGPKRILFVGRVCEHKGQLELIRVLKAIQQRLDAPVRLDLVGSVGSVEYKRKCCVAADAADVLDAVEWHGLLEEDELFQAYQNADLFLSFSQHEGFGMPLVEAMAFDLPVMALRRGAIAETLGVGGWLLDSPDPSAAADAVTQVLTEPQVRRRLIKAQRDNLTRFARGEVIPNFEATLSQFGFEASLGSALIYEGDFPAASQWRVEGPCESSYSLAIVNRELARALDHSGIEIGLLNRDNERECPVSRRLLDDWPEAKRLIAVARSEPVDIALRNQFPPYVADMRGRLRVLANFAWEETGLPFDWVKAFNQTLDLITVTSRFVGKTLRDNGVHTPIEVVGNGVDRLVDVVADELPPLRRLPGRVRFLHVSSGFPRKGVDVLLSAWGDAFTHDDPVELVIKSFANKHNTVEHDLASLAQEHAMHAPVRLVMDELAPSAMAALYDSADVVVAPSRGEGFALPLAEAGWRGKALITTAYGGQADFCNVETAWLCDFAFAGSQSHLDVPDSLWLEPDVASLAAAMREAAGSPEERARKGAAALAAIRARFRWDLVAARTCAAITRVEASTDKSHLPRVGWVSTFNSRCGIAVYSQGLIQAFPKDRLVVFANRDCEPLTSDEEHVRRVWMQGGESLEELEAALFEAALDAVVIQFNFGFFRLENLMGMLSHLHEAGVRTYLMMHSTMDVVRSETRLSLGDHVETLRGVERIFVHTLADMNRVKNFGLLENVSLFPHGLPTPLERKYKIQLEPGSNAVIATFGFLIANKGYQNLIRAFKDLRRDYPAARLLMLTALYPGDVSRDEDAACRALIAELELEGAVTLETDFLEEYNILTRLGMADVVCYPYQETQESASGSVKLGLASLTPVAHTPNHIFADVAGATFAFDGYSPEAIAAGLRKILGDSDLRSRLRKAQERLVAERNWIRLSHRLWDCLRGGTVITNLRA
jgi:glycosyltransferase involved in cell wall biosynthesis